MGAMLRPRDFGGQAMPAEEFLTRVAALAARDGSQGWRAALAEAASMWGVDAREPVAVGFGADGRLVGGVRGGRLSGHWRDVTGADTADWLLLAADGDRLVLVARADATVSAPAAPAGLSGAGLADVTVSEVPVAAERVFAGRDDAAAVLTGAAAAAAVAGAADGLWRAHVAQVRQRLAASYGSAETEDLTLSTRQVARAAADIDAATLQITASLSKPRQAAARAQRQAAARARDAADRVLGSSRGHALDASDPVTCFWRDVHTGARLTLSLLDALD